MLRLAGALIIVLSSLGLGRFLGDTLGRRIRDIEALAELADFISLQIATYKAPLAEIFAKCDTKYLGSRGFTNRLRDDVYKAALESGMLSGDEERQIMLEFSDKLGSGTSENMVKLCAYTSARLRAVSEKLKADLPEKRRVYRAVSALAGVSVVIMLI